MAAAGNVEIVGDAPDVRETNHYKCNRFSLVILHFVASRKIAFLQNNTSNKCTFSVTHFAFMIELKAHENTACLRKVQVHVLGVHAIVGCWSTLAHHGAGVLAQLEEICLFVYIEAWPSYTSRRQTHRSAGVYLRTT